MHCFKSIITIAALFALLLMCSPASAASTWDGGGGDDYWKTKENWQGDTAPGNFDNLTFTGTTRLNPNNDYTDSTPFGLITFNAGGFNVYGNRITLAGGMTNSAGNNTFNPALTLNATQTFSAATGTTLSLGGVLSGAGGLTKTGSGTVVLNGSNTYMGATAVSAGTLKIGDSGSINNSTAVNVSGTSVMKQTASNAIMDTAAVTLGGWTIWDMTDQTETVGAITTTQYGDSIVLGSGSLTSNNNSTTTFSISMSGTGGSFTKGGSGTLNLYGTFSYTGGTTINGGTLYQKNLDLMPDTGAVTVNNGAVYEAQRDTIGDLVINSGGKLKKSTTGSACYLTIDSLSGGGAIESVGSLYIYTGYDNSDTTFSGNWTTSGGNTDDWLYKRGSGTLTLSGTSSCYVGLYEGKVNVNGKTGPATVMGGATIGGSGTVSQIQVNSGGTISPGDNRTGTLTLQYVAYLQGGSHYLWEINNAAGTKGGSSGWDWLSAQQYISSTDASTTNRVVIDIYSLTADNVSGDAANFNNNTDYSWTIATGTLGNGISADKFALNYSNFTNPLNGGTFEIAVNSYDVILKFKHASMSWSGLGGNNNMSTTGNWAENKAPTGSAPLIFSGTGKAVNNDLTLTPLSVTFNSGGFTLGGNAMTVSGGIQNAAGTNAVNTPLTLSGDQSFSAAGGTTLTVGGTVNMNGKNLAVAAAGDIALNGIISGTGSLAKTGAGILTLGAANTFTGQASVAAGTLRLGAENALSGAADLIVSGGTVDMNNHNTAAGQLVLTDGTIGTAPGGGTLSAGAFNFQNGTVNAVLGGAGTLSKSGSGTVTLNAQNTYAGSTSVSDGTLKCGAHNALGSGDGAVSISGGVLDIDAYNAAVGDVLLTGGVLTGTTGVLSPDSMTVSGGTLSAVLGGTGTFTKSGAESFTLEGDHTYSGDTIVSEGALVINGSVANSEVVVNSGALLKGSGLMDSLSGAGTVAPGNSPGIMTVETQIDPTGGLDWDFEFNGFYPDWDNPTNSVNDLVRITGATPFADPGMTAANVIDIHFDVSSIAMNDIFQGGFFTDADADFATLISSAAFNYYIGGKLIGTNGYFELTTQPVTVDFLGAPGVTGFVAQFKALHEESADVPEPSTLLLLLPFIGFGLRKLRGKKA